MKSASCLGDLRKEDLTRERASGLFMFVECRKETQPIAPVPVSSRKPRQACPGTASRTWSALEQQLISMEDAVRRDLSVMIAWAFVLQEVGFRA